MSTERHKHASRVAGIREYVDKLLPKSQNRNSNYVSRTPMCVCIWQLCVCAHTLCESAYDLLDAHMDDVTWLDAFRHPDLYTTSICCGNGKAANRMEAREEADVCDADYSRHSFHPANAICRKSHRDYASNDKTSGRCADLIRICESVESNKKTKRENTQSNHVCKL